MDELKTLIRRLSRIGVNIEIGTNIPWVYLTHVNGILVQERTTEHGYNIAYIPFKDRRLQFDDIGDMFRIIRTYVQRSKETKAKVS